MLKRRGFFFFILIVFASSFRHPSSLIGEMEKGSPALRAGLLSDQGELESSLPTAPHQTTDKLPGKFSLGESLPRAGSQKGQASSVGWALGYVLKSYTENQKQDKPTTLSLLYPENPEDQKRLFSPTYLYNATNNGRDMGGSILQSLILLQSNGILTWKDLPYREDDFRSRNYLSDNSSRTHRIHQFAKIPTHQINQIKAYISQGNPLPASVLFYENFISYKKGEVISSHRGNFLGAQAVVIAGFDNAKKAFLILNSWGEDWGDNGYFWMDYNLFQKSALSVYWVDDPPPVPMPETLAKSYPTDIFASQGNFKDSVRISWNTVRGAIGYEIYRKRATDSNGKYELVGLSLNPNFEDRGVQVNLAYHYQVASVFDSESSLPYPGIVEGYASTQTKPSSTMNITGLQASQGVFKDRVEVTWNPIPGADSYHIYKYNPYSKQFRILAKTSKPGYVDRKALRNGSPEFYRVSLAGSFASSNLSHATIGHTATKSLDLIPPETLRASLGDYPNSIQLDWSDVEGAEKYRIYRMTSPSQKWEPIATTDKNQYMDKDPKVSAPFYSVVSLGKSGNPSRGSTPVLGRMSGSNERSMGPFPPQKLNGTVISQVKDNILARLTWEPVKGVNSYSVYGRKTGGSWKKIAVVRGNYHQTNISPQEFHIFAIASIGDSDLEGRRSQEAVVAYMEPVVDTSKARSFGADSNLEKFKGPWTAMYWDGKGSITQLQLVIQSSDEQNTSCKIQFNNRLIYQGEYIQETKINDPKGRFQIAMGDSEQALKMDVRDKNIFPESTTLSFVRE